MSHEKVFGFCENLCKVEVKSKEEVVPVLEGGTGATTGAEALSNLGLKDAFVQEEFTIASVSITAGNMQSYTAGQAVIHKNGYKPLAVTHAAVNNNVKCVLRSFRLVKNTEMFTATVVNPTNSSQADVGVTFGILYVKE